MANLLKAAPLGVDQQNVSAGIGRLVEILPVVEAGVDRKQAARFPCLELSPADLARESDVLVLRAWACSQVSVVVDVLPFEPLQLMLQTLKASLEGVVGPIGAPGLDAVIAGE